MRLGMRYQLLPPLSTPGPCRLLAVLPVVAANLLLPCLFCRGTDATAVVLVAFNTAWLSSFKVSAGVAWLCCTGMWCHHKRSTWRASPSCIAPASPVEVTKLVCIWSAGPVLGHEPRSAGRRPAHARSVCGYLLGAADAPPRYALPMACLPSEAGAVHQATAGPPSLPKGPPALGCRNEHLPSLLLAPADPPTGQKKGRLAEDAGGVWRHALNYSAKLAVMGVAVTLLLEFPQMPGILESFCLSESLWLVDCLPLCTEPVNIVSVFEACC